MVQEYQSDLYPENEFEPTAPVGPDFLTSGKPGIVDWLLALYLVAVGGMSATPIWFVSTYIAYGVTLIFIFTFDYGRVLRILSFWLLVGLVVWFSITSLRSIVPSASLNATWYITKIILFSIILMARCTSLSRLVLYFKAIIIGILVLAVSGAIIGYSSVVQGGAAEVGLTTQRNAFGISLFTGIITGIVLLPCTSKKWKAIVWIYFLAAFISLLASASRGATVACFMAFLLYFFLEYARYIRQNLKMIIPVVVLIISIPIVGVKLFPQALLIERMIELYHGGRAATSGRIDIYEHAWELFLSHKLFGIGPGMYRAYSSFVYTHTTFLEFLVTTGIPGFVLYYACYMYAWLLLRRLVKVYKGYDLPRKILNGCRSAVLATIIYGAFMPVHYAKGLSFFLAIIIGFAARCCWQLKQYEQIPSDIYYEEDQSHYPQAEAVNPASFS